MDVYCDLGRPIVGGWFQGGWFMHDEVAGIRLALGRGDGSGGGSIIRHVGTGRIHYLDTPPITDLYQIVEGEAGVFYIGARGHLLEYRLQDTPHYR